MGADIQENIVLASNSEPTIKELDAGLRHPKSANIDSTKSELLGWGDCSKLAEELKQFATDLSKKPDMLSDYQRAELLGFGLVERLADKSFPGINGGKPLGRDLDKIVFELNDSSNFQVKVALKSFIGVTQGEGEQLRNFIESVSPNTVVAKNE